MDKNSNSYVFGFAIVMCVVFSAALAAIANQLGPRIKANEIYDRQVNVMIAARLVPEEELPPRAQIEQLYRERVAESVLDEQGKVLPDMTPQQVYDIRDKKERERFHPLYTIKDAQGQVAAYVIPISGYGLWSTLYGFLALKADANEVVGITFYKHGETPGLGGEVDNPEWKKQWRGKKILGPDQQVVSVTVKKGHVDFSRPLEVEHYVDGLSGATITSDAVTRFVKTGIAGKDGSGGYAPFFEKIWKGQQGQQSQQGRNGNRNGK